VQSSLCCCLPPCGLLYHLAWNQSEG
jgi:hypothetical protein